MDYHTETLRTHAYRQCKTCIHIYKTQNANCILGSIASSTHTSSWVTIWAFASRVFMNRHSQSVHQVCRGRNMRDLSFHFSWISDEGVQILQFSSACGPNLCQKTSNFGTRLMLTQVQGPGYNTNIFLMALNVVSLLGCVLRNTRSPHLTILQSPFPLCSASFLGCVRSRRAWLTISSLLYHVSGEFDTWRQSFCCTGVGRYSLR